MKDFVDVMRKYAVFQGRTARKPFWVFMAVVTFINYALIILDERIGWSFTTVLERPYSGVLYGLSILIFCLPALAVGIRRLHDAGRSGWWMLVPFISCYFWLVPSEGGPNQWGPNPHVVKKAHGAAPRPILSPKPS